MIGGEIAAALEPFVRWIVGAAGVGIFVWLVVRSIRSSGATEERAERAEQDLNEWRAFDDARAVARRMSRKRRERILRDEAGKK